MHIQAPRSTARFAFSLVELLVVLAIIVLLVTILFPVISHVRNASRATGCLANLQQWGHLYQIYLGANKVQALPEMATGPDAVAWWEALSPDGPDRKALLLCPEARLPTNESPPANDLPSCSQGSSTSAWIVRTGGGIHQGSYGLNMWAYQTPNRRSPEFIQYPTRDATTIPLLGDCIGPWEVPRSGSPVPPNLTQGGAGIGAYCIDRHASSVNLVFLDGHAERITLANLWKLKWSQNSTPVNVTIP